VRRPRPSEGLVPPKVRRMMRLHPPKLWVTRGREQRTAAMRIELDSPAAAAALLEYLRRCECLVVWAGESAIEASPPPRSQGELASLELDA
jgi:hypothetical protein